MKTLKEMASERKAERIKEAMERDRINEIKRAKAEERRKKQVAIGLVTYSISALEESLERAKQKEQKAYNDAISAGRSESCAIAISTYYAGIAVKRYTTMLACANTRNET